MTNDIAGKTYLITGASQGIGLATAMALAEKGAHLVLVGRNEARTAKAAQAVRGRHTGAKVDYLIADLSRFADIRQLAETVRARYPRLDVLLNNAGGMTHSRQEAEGFEMCWKLNHLAYVLLTAELLPLLKASQPARIINVASTAHYHGRINFDDLQSEQKFGMWAAYGQSKLANVMFTYALARRLQGSGVTANCLHPGVVGSGFAANIGPLERMFAPLINFFLITPEKGAKTSIYLASSADVDGVNGKYFDKCKPTQTSAASYDEAAQERLWALSLEQAGVAAF